MASVPTRLFTENNCSCGLFRHSSSSEVVYIDVTYYVRMLFAYRTAVTLYTYTRHLAISLLCDEPSHPTLPCQPSTLEGRDRSLYCTENVRMCNFFSATIGCTGCSSPRAKDSGQGMTMESSAARKMQTYPIPISPSCFPSRLLLSPDADCPPLLNGTFHPSRSTALPASIAVYSCTSAARSQGPAITPRTSTTPASRIVRRPSCIVRRASCIAQRTAVYTTVDWKRRGD